MSTRTSNYYSQYNRRLCIRIIRETPHGPHDQGDVKPLRSVWEGNKWMDELLWMGGVKRDSSRRGQDTASWTRFHLDEVWSVNNALWCHMRERGRERWYDGGREGPTPGCEVLCTQEDLTSAPVTSPLCTMRPRPCCGTAPMDPFYLKVWEGVREMSYWIHRALRHWLLCRPLCTYDAARIQSSVPASLGWISGTLFNFQNVASEPYPSGAGLLSHSPRQKAHPMSAPLSHPLTPHQKNVFLWQSWELGPHWEVRTGPSVPI